MCVHIEHLCRTSVAPSHRTAVHNLGWLHWVCQAATRTEWCWSGFWSPDGWLIPLMELRKVREIVLSSSWTNHSMEQSFGWTKCTESFSEKKVVYFTVQLNMNLLKQNLHWNSSANSAILLLYLASIHPERLETHLKTFCCCCRFSGVLEADVKAAVSSSPGLKHSQAVSSHQSQLPRSQTYWCVSPLNMSHDLQWFELTNEL